MPLSLKQQRISLTAGKFNHCSSVCSLPNGVLIAWYAGSGECQDDQSVHLLFIDKNNKESEIVRVGNKTGNPVVWRDGQSVLLLWSRFEDDGPIVRLADRWKYCSLWLQRVTPDGPRPKLGRPRLLTAGQNLLARCNPIEVNSNLYLPLYNELLRTNVIFAKRGRRYLKVGMFGQDMIQPTLWFENDRLCSLSRNFGGYRTKSQYAESFDHGKSWSGPIDSTISNYNSSLHVVMHRGRPYVAWNDSHSPRRSHLTLGLLHRLENKIIIEPETIINSDYGAYPSLSSTGTELHLSYTTKHGTIAYETWI